MRQEGAFMKKTFIPLLYLAFLTSSVPITTNPMMIAIQAAKCVVPALITTGVAFFGYFHDRGLSKQKKQRKGQATQAHSEYRASQQAPVQHIPLDDDAYKAKIQQDYAQVQAKQQKHNRYKEHVTTALNQSEGALHEWLDAQEHSTITQTNENALEGYIVKRRQALTEHLQGNDRWGEQHYALDAATHNLLAEHGINQTHYKTLYGNQLQHVLHQEFVEILDDTAQLRYNNTTPKDIKLDVCSTLTLFADAGHTYNRAGRIDTAFSYADFCWKFLECAQEVARFGYDMGKAVGRGAAHGTSNFFKKVTNPKKTVKNVAIGLCKLSSFIRSQLYTVGAGIAHDAQELWNGEITLQELHNRDIQNMEQWCELRVHQACAAVHFVYDNLEREKIIYAAQKGTEVVTEAALTHVTCQALGSVFSKAGAYLGKLTEHGNVYARLASSPASGGSLNAALALDSLHTAEQVAVITQDICAASAITLNAASFMLPPLEFAAKTSSSSQATTVSGAPMPPNPDEAKKIEELIELQKKFRVRIDGIDQPLHPSLLKIDSNKINHLLADRHNWYKLVTNPKNPDAVLRLINKVLLEGSCEPIRNDVFLNTLCIGNEIVQVKYVNDIVDGISIGTAWIN